jgi:MFS family permease
MSYARDSKLLTTAAGVRGFGQGFMIIIVVLYLEAIKFNPIAIGILLGLAYAGSVLANLFVSFYADRMGRRRSLLLLSTLHFILAPMMLVFNQAFIAVAAAFFIGAISVTGSGSDGFTPVEAAMLPRGATRERRNFLFSFYNVSKSLLTAVGSLFAGLLASLETAFHLAPLDAFHFYFVTYAGLGIVLLFVYLRLASPVEANAKSEPPKTPAPAPVGDRRKEYSVIAKLSGLFAIDTFGSGLLTNAIVTLWLTIRFNLGPGEIAIMFFAGQMIQTVSLPVSAMISNRIGLIRTMVATQIPNNVFAVLMGLSPTFPIAVIFYVAKSLVGTMDTPARQAYTISVVGPDKQVAASGITNTSIGAARSLSSATAGYLIQGVGSSSPFFFSSAIKLTYDLLLYLGFRHQER